MTLQSSRTDISSDCLKSLTGANCNLGFMKSFFFLYYTVGGANW